MPTITNINKEKYLGPPSLEQIDDFIKKKLKVSYYHFESFFGMPRGTLKVVRNGYMALPPKYWHIFFEQPDVKPGQSYHPQEVQKMPQKRETHITMAPILKKHEPSNHPLLGALR